MSDTHAYPSRHETSANVAARMSTVYDADPPLHQHWHIHIVFANVGPMLGHRLRRWPNIGQTLGGCLLFAGMLLVVVLLLKKDTTDNTYVPTDCEYRSSFEMTSDVDN